MPLYCQGCLNANITDVSQVSVTTWDGEPITTGELEVSGGDAVVTVAESDCCCA